MSNVFDSSFSFAVKSSAWKSIHLCQMQTGSRKGKGHTKFSMDFFFHSVREERKAVEPHEFSFLFDILISWCCYPDFLNLLNASIAFSIPKQRSQNAMHLHLSCRLHFFLGHDFVSHPRHGGWVFLAGAFRPHRSATYYFYHFISKKFQMNGILVWGFVVKKYRTTIGMVYAKFVLNV